MCEFEFICQPFRYASIYTVYNKEIKSIFIHHRHHRLPFIVFDIHLLADERTTAVSPPSYLQ